MFYTNYLKVNASLLFGNHRFAAEKIQEEEKGRIGDKEHRQAG